MEVGIQTSHQCYVYSTLTGVGKSTSLLLPMWLLMIPQGVASLMQSGDDSPNSPLGFFWWHPTGWRRSILSLLSVSRSPDSTYMVSFNTAGRIISGGDKNPSSSLDHLWHTTLGGGLRRVSVLSYSLVRVEILSPYLAFAGWVGPQFISVVSGWRIEVIVHKTSVLLICPFPGPLDTKNKLLL